MRRAVTRFFRLCLRIFFRRIELMGLDRIPDRGAVIFAVNHPNGLVDPLFLLCYSGRVVSFLAKAPLFDYFFIGWFVRAFEAIPVYRKQDPSTSLRAGNTTGSNRETFEKARTLLQRGGSIAIFPEGTSHDDPQLRELKTGAARIALGAQLEEMTVVPTGIYYTAKHLFRSSALVVFGDPLRVTPVDVDEQGEPPAEDVDRLTAQIDAGLDAVTLQADSHAALELIAKAEDIFTANEDLPLSYELQLRRRFIDAYRHLRTSDPARLEKLQSSISQFDAELRRAKFGVHELEPRIGLLQLFRVLILLPLAIIGAIVTYPTYRLIAVLARRFSKGEGAMMATVKFVAALALYPATYLLFAILIGWRFGLMYGVAAAVLLPFLGYIALRVFEEIDDMIGDARALAHRIFRRYGHARLVAQRQAIFEEMVRVATELESRSVSGVQSS